MSRESPGALLRSQTDSATFFPPVVPLRPRLVSSPTLTLQTRCVASALLNLIAELTPAFALIVQQFRVEGTLRNFEKFAEVWQCKKGSRFNPEKRCALW